ncbi:hypothetical protein QMK19_30320 [Streptomyces sp. H10-C2]|uniref:hypothetical protein n=1 Tax=unclassified Streptomyces TaxID=2593676 RepID=UPI0024BB6105|nr:MULTISPECIES: hypothetical protein [unclassified Streptomyces]MDJ0344913.1 hypothetical protein [Streptomyces sp. PH10-H1]MDJ0373829.1 hypothetical protein [Streptomyces sp. H10-C2]
MDIELVVVADCPNERPAADLMRQALKAVGEDKASFSTRVITTQAEAEQSGFTGSPTFLIQGRDPFADPGRPPGLSCRLYTTPRGVAGLPDMDQLQQALIATRST